MIHFTVSFSPTGGEDGGESSQVELQARILWESQRDDILLSALTASPGGRPLPILLTLGGSGSGGGAAPSAAVAPLSLHPAPVAIVPTLHISGRSSGEESQDTNSQRMFNLNLIPTSQAPRGQLLGQSANVLSPATPRTIANRIARARSANISTASKQVPATREPRTLPRMSPQLGSPLCT